LARKLIKGLKDLDYSLVSNENLSHNIPPSGWGPGPNALSQKGLNLPHKKNKAFKKFLSSN